ncbi:hypothetical protein GDO81_009449 [Engystomops pustulosus]|uniref:Uncharacterized protein n=1 Tax=Engystomops pustulosus TaxID=76066 RepID=A0AAV7BRG2_ENGPU|nr:hypothetical protein GDO81_009449 [Engystomops pustulosus]
MSCAFYEKNKISQTLCNMQSSPIRNKKHIIYMWPKNIKQSSQLWTVYHYNKNIIIILPNSKAIRLLAEKNGYFYSLISVLSNIFYLDI